MGFGASANEASFCFEIFGSAFSFRVLSFEAVEAISSPFQVNVMVSCEDAVSFEEVVGMEAVLTLVTDDLEASGGNRYFHGDVAKLKEVGDNGEYHLYRVRLVPAIWRLSLEQDCRIFQNTTLQSIIETVLNESGITSDRYRFELKDEALKSLYCVQYNENDFNFISRLLEEEGIFYYFEHSEDKHVVVFSDFSFFCDGIPGNPVLSHRTSGGMVPETESISAFNLSTRLSPDTAIAQSFNYKRTSLDLTSEEDSGKQGASKIYEYAGTFGSEERGRKMAQTRLQEYSALERKAKGESNCPRLTSGCTFTLHGSGSTNLQGEYLLLGVEHVGDQPQSLDSLAGGSTEYWNGFVCVPSSVNVRPSRMTPKPVIPGMQTAIVTGPPGEEIYHDEFGRVKVQFHWDRKGNKNDRSSCWLRYAQGWGGGGWGMQFIPRVGDEVLVAFLDGDPDRPVIVGSLYNSANMPLYNPRETKTLCSIKTRSYPNGGADNFHELRFDDKKGSEEIYLQSERDWNVLVKNDIAQQVLHDETLQVGNDRSKAVGRDQVAQIGGNDTETIGANKTTSIGSNKTEKIAFNCLENVGLAKELFVGGAYQIGVAGAMNETVMGAKAEEVGITKHVLVGEDMMESVKGRRSLTVGEDLTATITHAATVKAKTIILEGDEELILKSGSATIVLRRNGEIVIDGTSCTGRASGEIVLKGARASVN